MSDVLAGLNEPQLEAATHGEGPLLVIAGAGTGKTRVITRRIGYLVQQGAHPEEILALAFSTKAAGEMRDRAEELIEGSYEELTVSTFHSFCANLLREEAFEAGVNPFFEPIAPADRLALLIENLHRVTLREHEIRGNPARLLDSFIKRIDRCKDELVDATEYQRWARAQVESANDDGELLAAKRQLEFAKAFAVHDELLDEAGVLDFGDLIRRSLWMLRDRSHVLKRVADRYRWLLVDEFQDTNFAQGELLRLVGLQHGNVTVVGDDDQSIYRFRGASRKNIIDFEKAFPNAKVVRLTHNYRCGEPIVAAAQPVVAANSDRLDKELAGTGPASVRFWRCDNERAQAQTTAAEIEQLLADGVEPESIGVLMRSVKNDGQRLISALDEHGIPYRLTGASAYFQRSEVRDILAWLRLLADPADSSAVTRALMRPPVEIRPSDLARLTQIARRRKIDMVSACEPALKSPQLPPPARERLLKLTSIHDRLANAFDRLRPEAFVELLIRQVGVRTTQLFEGDADSVLRLLNVAKFIDLAARYERRDREATARDFASYVRAVTEAGLVEDDAEPSRAPGAVQVMTMHSAKGLEFDHVFVLGLTKTRMPGRLRPESEPVPDELLKERLPEDTREAHVAEMRRLLYVAMTRAGRNLILAWPDESDAGTAQKPSPFVEEAMAALGAEPERIPVSLFGPHENLNADFRMMREELFETVARVGGRIGEMRLDTSVDLNHAIVRFLELLKLAALIERRPEQPLAESIDHVSQVLSGAVTAEQREILQSSGLDEFLLSGERDEERRRQAIESTLEHSLEAFLPKHGQGLVLSATDIDGYRTCPLQYKFARVYGLPREQTIQQRFGILMHRVLERYHATAARNGGGAQSLLNLFELGWRRAGFGASDEEVEYRNRAVEALKRYQERFDASEAEPVWFERNFTFDLGAHHLRGRVDRVDRLPDGGYELIDYKTGKPKSQRELKEDVQLCVYQMGARAAWDVDPEAQTYYYILDNKKVELEPSEEQLEHVRELVDEVAARILAQEFEPRPSFQVCRTCDFQLICPAAET